MANCTPDASGIKPAVPVPLAPPPSLQPQHHPSPLPGVTFPCVLTDALFEQWLDGDRGRRAGHERQTPDVRATERQRVSRMFILRGCDMALALNDALTLACDLEEKLRSLTKTFAPLEAARLLRAAGLPIPNPLVDITCGYGGDEFQESHTEARKLARRLREFIDHVSENLMFLIPKTPTEGMP